MNRIKVTESEIIDVLLGQADVELQNQVHEAVQQDLECAARYAEWQPTTHLLSQQLAPVRAVCQRVSTKVCMNLGQVEMEPPRTNKKVGRGRFLHTRSMKHWAVTAAVLVLGMSLAFWMIQGRWRSHFEVTVTRGKVDLLDSSGYVSESLTLDTRLHFPTRLRVPDDAQVTLHLPHRTQMIVSGSTELALTGARDVTQQSGSVNYTVSQQGPSLDSFTVTVPQGRIVDLGTVFDVTVRDELVAHIQVRSGEIRAKPKDHSGESVLVGANTGVILNRQQAVLYTIPEPNTPAVLTPTTPDPSPLPARQQRVSLQPRVDVMKAGDPLLMFVQAQIVTLSKQPIHSDLKIPPMTLEPPLSGTLGVRSATGPVEVTVLCDRKLDGTWRIYWDANLNRDLSDDPVFVEGEDFVGDGLFSAGLSDRHDHLWLKRPISIDRSVSPPRLQRQMDRLEVYNRCYRVAEVNVVNTSGSTSPIQRRVLLLDSDSDGDYGDRDGSLLVWARPGETGIGVRAVVPTQAAFTDLGSRWSLERTLSGDYTLVGTDMQLDKRRQLKPGDILKGQTLHTVDGQTVYLGPPEQGFLLVHVWSTWYSLCQQDQPMDVHDLYRHFKGRGLSMVGISTDYSQDDLVTYLRQHRIEVPQIFDGPDLSQGLTARLGLYQSPTLVLVDQTGTVLSVGQSVDALWSTLNDRLRTKAYSR